jgi:PKD repeat protein
MSGKLKTSGVVVWVLRLLCLFIFVSNEPRQVLSVSQAPQCVAAPSGLVSWWSAEGNAHDIVGTNNGSLQGTVSFGTGESGQAFNFDGTSGHIRIADSISLDLTNALSIDAWIFPSAITNDFPTIVSKWDAVVVNQRSYALVLDVNRKVIFRLSPDGLEPGFPSNLLGTVISNLSVPLNEWTHVAGTYDGQALSIYINGILDNQANYTQGAFSGTNDFAIGALVGGMASGQSVKQFAGSIDEVDLFNRALTASEIQIIFNAGSAGKCKPQLPACVPPPTGIVSWWPGEGNANDIIAGNNGILHGNITFPAGEVAQGFHFNGIDQFVEIPDTATQRPSTITIGAWVKLDSLDSPGGSAIPGLQYIVFKKNTRDVQFEGYTLVKFRDTGGNNHFAFVVSSAEGTQIQAVSTTAVSIGQFYHLAGTYDQTTVKLYVNGMLEAQVPASFPLNYSTRPLCIGASNEPQLLDGKFNGSIDEVDLFNRALTASEIQSIFYADSAGKCKPQLAVCSPPPTGIISWWSGDGNTADLVGDNTGIISGGVTFVPGKVDQAFHFNGTDAFVQLPGTFGGGPEITLEAWVKTDQTTSDFQAIVAPIAQEFVHLQLFDIGNIAVYTDQGPLLLPIILQTPTGVFRHIALSAKPGDTRLYVDGTLYATSSFAFSQITPTSSLRIGSGYAGGRFFTGSIDEVTIYNRALSGSEIVSIANEGSGGKCKRCSVACTASATSATIAGTSVFFLGTAAPSAGCIGPPLFDWDFGDASTHSSLQSPSHTYATPGTYNWTMRVSIGAGQCEQSGRITVSQAQFCLTSSVSPPGSGTVLINPLGPCYGNGASVQLEASAAPGFVFDHWSGDASGTANPLNIVMDSEKHVIANFNQGAPGQPDFKLPLEGGKDWLLSVEIGTPAPKQDCKSAMGGRYYCGGRDCLHSGKDAYALDFLNNTIQDGELGGRADVDILAAADGVVDRIVDGLDQDVTTAKHKGCDCFGNYVVIKHGSDYVSLYGHMQKNSITVCPGQTVKRGDRLGVMGTSGESTGIHVHFQIQYRGQGDAESTILNQLLVDDRNISTYTVGSCSMPTYYPSTNTPRSGNGTSEPFRINGGPPTHPNGTLIKERSTGTIFVIESGKKRPISSLIVLAQLYTNGGFNLKDAIFISSDEMSKYPIGQSITQTLNSNNHREPDGRLIKNRRTGEISIITDNGKRRAFACIQAFINLGYSLCNVLEVSEAQYRSYTDEMTEIIDLGCQQ